MRTILTQLASDGWTLNPAKIQWLKDNLEYLGIHISQKGIQLPEGMISGLTDLPRPKTARQLRSLFVLKIQWQQFQGNQFRTLYKLLSYKRAPDLSFNPKAFESLWNTVLTRLASGTFQLVFWHPPLLLQVHVDASAAGFGGLISGVNPVTKQGSLLAMYSKNNIKNYQYPSVAEVDGLIACFQ